MGFRVEPAIPSQWDELEIDKVFRGRQLHIHIKNPDHAQSGVRKMLVNGAEVEGSYIPENIMTEKTEVEILCHKGS